MLGGPLPTANGAGALPGASATQPDSASPVTTLLSGLRLTELMFDPPLGDPYEFLEFKNIGAATLDLAGLTFTKGITYTFPAGATLAPGAHLLLTRAVSVATFRSYYNVPAGVTVLAPYSGKLDNKGEEVTLRTALDGAKLISFTYDDARGWPVPPQGGGHSLVPLPSAVPTEPDDSLDYGGNWKASVYIKGSPGRAEPATPPAGPLLSEFNAHTDPSGGGDSNDWIELHNPTASAITLNGDWYLSDDLDDLRKYSIGNRTISPGGYPALDEQDDFHPSPGVGFGLNKAGECILLSYLPGASQDRIVDCLRFESQANGPTTGRYPATSPWWQAMDATRGKANAAPDSHVVLNEVMYHPTEDTTATEYLELYNPTSKAVNLWTNDGEVRSWRVSGEIDYAFPPNTTMQPGDYFVLVSFPPANTALMNAFKTKYGLPAAAHVFGPYTNGLDNHGGRVSLEKSQAGDIPDPLTLISWIVVDEVIYFDQSPFPTAPDGSGSTLQRQDELKAGLDPSAWTALLPTPGRSRTTPPTVANAPATALDLNAATLNGRLLSSGGVAPTVKIYWGASDSGTNAAAWQHSVSLGARTPGAFSASVSGLAMNTAYYYRCCAVHSGGTVWASASQSFKTPQGYALSVTATGGSVSRQPSKTLYIAGEPVKLTATPSGGKRFGYWRVGGETTLYRNNPLTLTMDGARTVTAQFFTRSAAAPAWTRY